MKTAWSIILFLLLHWRLTNAQTDNYHELCRLFKNTTQLRYPGSCEQFIKCQNQKGFTITCNSPTPFYDRNKQTCVSELKGDDYCRNRCEGLNNKWVADPINCHGFYYCDAGVPKQGYCPNDAHFNEKQQICTYATTSDCIDVSSICELVPEKTKFIDESSCTAYYECGSGGKKSKKECSKNTYFDVESGTCKDKNLVNCRAHPIPKNLCGTDKKPLPGSKSDGMTCRGYFQCANLGIVADLEPRWIQCPNGLFFNTTTQSCVEPINAICNYNRCEGQDKKFVSSSKNNCHNYIICENGQMVEEITCSRDYFFDEQLQACVPFLIYYPCCDGQK